MSITTWWSSLRMHCLPMCVLSRHMPSRTAATLSASKLFAFSAGAGHPHHLAAELLDRRLELAAVRLAHRVVGVEDVDLLAHLVDDVPGEAVGLHPRVGLVAEVLLVELRRPHELGARHRIPVDRLVLLGDVHHGHGGAARDGANDELDVVLEDQLLGLAHGGRGLGLVVLGDHLDLVAEHAALGVQLLDGHLHEHRLVLAVALEDTDLAAEVADLDDLRLRERGRGQETAGDEQRRRHHQPGESLHEFLLDGVVVDGVVVLTMRSDRICAMRPNAARTRTGSGAAAAGRARPSASSYASRIATDARASRWPTAKSARL